MRTLEKAVGLNGTQKVRALVKGEKSAQLLDFLNKHRLETGRIERFPDDVDADWGSRKRFLLEAINGTLNHDRDDQENL